MMGGCFIRYYNSTASDDPHSFTEALRYSGNKDGEKCHGEEAEEKKIAD